MASSAPHRRHSTPRKNSSFLGCVGDFTSSTMPRVKLRPSMNRKRSLFINYPNDSDDTAEESDQVDGERRRPKHGAAAADGVLSSECVLNWKVEELAGHLTLISQAIFQDLQPYDLKSLKWYNPRMKNHPESQRVNEITRRFNYDAQWTVKEVLREELPRHRAEVMSHFIRVTKRLFELNNFHTSYAVFSGLESAPIARLRVTRDLLAKRDRTILEDLGTVFNPENNWQAFREYQESAGFPRIPHIGFYKTDLIHAYHAYSNTNGERDRRMAIIEERVLDLFHRSNYGFLESANPALQTHLKGLRYLEELQRFVDDENIKRSRQLEPDAMATPDAKVMEKVTGSGGGGALSGVKKRLSQVNLDHHSRQSEFGGLGDSSGLNKTNLIDDSHIEDLGIDSLSSSGSPSSRFSQTSSSANSLKSLTSLLPAFDWQGLIERKTIIRHGNFQYFPRWKRLWAAVAGTTLVTFKPKSTFRASVRGHFLARPSDVTVLSQWRLVMTGREAGKSASLLEFTLMRGAGEGTEGSGEEGETVWRVKAPNVTEYLEWVKFLRSAIARARNPANLISFDV